MWNIPACCWWSWISPVMVGLLPFVTIPFSFPGLLTAERFMPSTISNYRWTPPASLLSSACLEKLSCLHILICTDALVHQCCANLFSRGSRTRHQTKAFEPKNWSLSCSVSKSPAHIKTERKHWVWMPLYLPLCSRLRLHFCLKFRVSRPDLNLSWLLNCNTAQTIGRQQQDMAYSSADLRKWLSVNNSPLLGRNMTGTMEECKFRCFSIKPSACQEENNASKDW